MSETSDSHRLDVLLPVLERFVAKRIDDPDTAADIAQTTVERMLTVTREFDDGAFAAYIFASARNAITDEHRRNKTSQRHLPRMLEPSSRGNISVIEPLLEEEEYAAIRTALGKLKHHEREALVVHHGEGVELARLAETGQDKALAVKLARYRAKLRLEYLLAFRRQTLSSNECRSVLMALSLGDRRRQGMLHAGDHLNECTVCSSLAPALIERRRAMAGVLPFGALAASRPAKWIRGHPWASSGAVTGSVALAVGAVAMSTNPSPTPVSACSAQITVNGTGLNAFQDGAAAESAVVEVRGAPVAAVPANEGFWINCADKRLWVQMLDSSESTTTVQPGHLVSFRAVLRHHSIGYAQTVGVDSSEGAPELDGVGLHAEVNANAITQSP